MSERMVPWNPQAEEAVLGAMMAAPTSVIPVVTQTLTAEDFYRPSDAEIYEAIIAMWLTSPESVDQVTVAGKLPEHRDYIFTLSEACVMVSNVGYYAEIVKRDSIARALVKAGQEIVELGFDREAEATRLIDHAESKLTNLRPENNKHTHKLSDLGHDILSAVRSGDKPKMVSTGFRSIDEYAKGLYAGNFVIIGARPGIGKTALGLAVARRVSEEGTVMFFSMEMKAEELMERLISAESCVGLTKIRERSLNPDELERITSATGELEKCDLRLIDDSRMTALNLCSQVRTESKSCDLKLVVVDYLQLMNMGTKTENRREEVSEMSRKLKSLAMEVNVPIIALSQLNRMSTFDGTKVDISQLKESGSLEQDADMVWLMSWPKVDEYGQKSVIVDVAKNRHGPIGEVQLIWLPQYTRYEE